MAKRGRSPKRGAKPPPVCKAILLCDTIIKDALTGKTSLIGLFDGFGLAKIPGQTSPVIAFLQLIEGIGDYILSVEIHDLQADKVIARATTSAINFPDRLHRREVVIPVPPLNVDHEGVYDFVVLANNKEVDRQQFKVILIREEQDETEEPEDTD